MEYMLATQPFNTLLHLHILSTDDAGLIHDSVEFLGGLVGVHSVQVTYRSSRFDHIIARFSECSRRTSISDSVRSDEPPTSLR